MQAGHDAQIRGTKELIDFVRLVMLGDKYDRAIPWRAMPGVDVVRKSLRLLLQSAIAGQLAACGRSHLEQRKAAGPLRVLGEKRVDRLHAVDDALRIVEPLDPDRQPNIWRQSDPLPHNDAAIGNRLLPR